MLALYSLRRQIQTHLHSHVRAHAYLHRTSRAAPVQALPCMIHRLQHLSNHTHPRTFSNASMPATRQQDNPQPSLTSRTKHAPGNAPVAKTHRVHATDCTQHWEDEEHLAQNKAAFQEFRAAAAGRKPSSASSTSASAASTGSDSASPADDDHHGAVPAGMKRGRGANHPGDQQSKKPKSTDRDRDHDPDGLPRGDKTRVPRVGQHVHWKHGKGFASGDVVEVLYAETEVDGHTAQASKEDPRLVLRTASSGRRAVHKPEDVYFD